VCEKKSRHDIQKTNFSQLLVLAAFVAFVILTARLFNERFSREPYDLFGISATSKPK